MLVGVGKGAWAAAAVAILAGSSPQSEDAQPRRQRKPSGKDRTKIKAARKQRCKTRKGAK